MSLVVCAGIAVIDHAFRLEEFPHAAAKARAEDFAAVVGGCAANAAVSIARLGGRARLSAPLGADAIGDGIVARLEREGVDCGGVIRVAGATSPISAILVDRAGERIIVNHRDARLDAARVADPGGLVADADVVLIDNRFPDFVLPVAQAGRRSGVPVLLDGDKPTRATDALLRTCSHIVFSAEGLRATAGSDDLDAALGSVARHTDAFLAVTDGPRDMRWREGGAVRRLPAFKVDAVDTLGAGDVFHGAFALALAEGRHIEAAMRFSAAAAALKCTRFGGGAGAPERAEVERFLVGRA
jgi:sulfofructose kinase